MLRAGILLPFILLLAAGCGGGDSAGAPAFVAQRVTQGLNQPSSFAFAPDGRLFVAEKGGAVRLIKNGALTTVLTLSVSVQSERGLESISFDPQYSSGRPYVYLYYTTSAGSLNPPSSPANRLSRFTLTGDTIDKSSETIIIDNIPSVSGIHNGGGVGFGPDGKLYVSTGDGGVSASAQDLGSLSGKVLRLNPDGSIPSDNPFAGQAGRQAEIWCYGLRNPFRFTFRADNGAMLIADVGQNTWEEVNVGAPGANYGWPLHEGAAHAAGFVDPVYAYNHNGSGAAIVGGPWLKSNSYPAAYQHVYYYGDWVRSEVYRVTLRADNSVQSVDRFGPAEGATGFDQQPVDLEQGPDGDLYVATFSTGEVWRIHFP